MYEEYIIPDKAPNVSGADLIVKAGLYLFYARPHLSTRAWSSSSTIGTSRFCRASIGRARG